MAKGNQPGNKRSTLKDDVARVFTYQVLARQPNSPVRFVMWELRKDLCDPRAVDGTRIRVAQSPISAGRTPFFTASRKAL